MSRESPSPDPRASCLIPLRHLNETNPPLLCLTTVMGLCPPSPNPTPMPGRGLDPPRPTNQAGNIPRSIPGTGEIPASSPQGPKRRSQFFATTVHSPRARTARGTRYTRPLDEGFHYYTAESRRRRGPRPEQPHVFRRQRWGSAVEVPAKDQEFYALRDVPHGQLPRSLLPSRALEPNAAPSSTPRGTTRIGPAVPVLYLQHGWGERKRLGCAGSRAREFWTTSSPRNPALHPLVVITARPTMCEVGRAEDFDITPSETVLVKN